MKHRIPSLWDLVPPAWASAWEAAGFRVERPAPLQPARMVSCVMCGTPIPDDGGVSVCGACLCA